MQLHHLFPEIPYNTVLLLDASVHRCKIQCISRKWSYTYEVSPRALYTNIMNSWYHIA